jgi:integrase
VIAKIEKRSALSIAEKVRTWFNQLFRYALVIVPGLEQNPASDLDVVALPLPPVRHNPFLRMAELPKLLQRLRSYRGRRQTQLGLRLLLLTGVRTGELRQATPDQFDLARAAVDHPARGREATPVGYAQEAAAADGHPTIHRAVVDSGHGDRPAPAG